MATLRELLDEGLVHHRAGRLEAAEKCYEAALAIDPGDAEANHLCGVLAFQGGRLDVAATHFRAAVAGNGAVAKYHGNLGAALLALRCYGEAEAALRRAAALDPDNALVQVNLATACRELGRFDEAIAAGRRAAALAPDDAAAHTGLALSFLCAGRYEEAVAAAEAAVAADATDAEALNILGTVMRAAGRDAAAMTAFENALALAPDFIAARCNLAQELQARHRYEAAAAQYRLAIDVDPRSAIAHTGLASALRQQGRVEEALPHYRRAVELDAANARYRSNLLFNLLGDERTDGRRLLAEHRDWAARFADPLTAAATTHDNIPDPGRRLRVGYVSPDLRNHPVGRLLLPVLRAHDPAAVEVACYSVTRRGDDVTEALRAAVPLWREVAGMDDAALAAAVRADGVDILVDLAGHTAHNRLLAFARRPAPVQATWLGYPSTTGMGAIDWLIADPVHAPEEADAEFAERVLRLPHDLLCFTPPADAPAPAPPPCRAAGHVTFGSFNHPGKLSAATLELWARVLARVPGSRLLVRYLVLEDRAAHDHLRARFAAAGVDPAHIEFAGHAPYRAVLESYGRVDIALDPTPYSGTMTTLEALWMGVPVVALLGDRMAARQSAAHLTAAGLAELVARNADDYVDLACTLAADPKRLSRLRADMRRRLVASPLLDVHGFTRALEGAYRTMWRAWCRNRGA